jgi:mannose-6-phosphate isomerase-like protein (cupin superfamily)
MELVDKQSAEHYSWGSGCDGWHLLKTPALSVIEERMPPGRSEVRHYHQKASQVFYVLSGSLSIEVDGEVFELNARQSLSVAAGKSHQVQNLSAENVELLVISHPPSHEDRVTA